MHIKYKKYPKYKDSGVEWLGQIPENWELTRLGTRFKERRTKVSDKEYPALSVTKNGTVPQLANAAKTNDGDNRKLVKKGDFVINSRSDRKGSSGIAFQDGSVSLINIVLEPMNIDTLFCNYLLKSYAFIEEFYRVGHGIVADLWTTRYDEMKNIKTSLPPLPEQTTIANFLDDKTAKIDKAISNKQKLIELLKERKQIIIQNAVTKGLNPNVKMKDSGVEWIGEIPEHWEVKRLKYILNLRNEKVSSLNSGLHYVGMENIESKSGRYLQNYTEVEGLANKFYAGDILFGKLRPYLAKVYLAKFNGICSTEFLVYKNSDPDYFSKLLISDAFIQIVNSSTYGAKMPRASADFIGNLQLPIPPIQEQTSIVAHIKTQSTKIEKAIALQEKQIETLKEYKTVLIDNAVTGKIKVS